MNKRLNYLEELNFLQEQYGMTLRQAEIYRLYREGLTVADIARHVGNTQANTDAQLKRALSKVVLCDE